MHIPQREHTPAIDWITGAFGQSVVEIPGESCALEADLFDPSLGIAIEFVSITSYYDNGGPRQHSTAYSYDFKDIAEFLTSHVEDAGRGVYFGAFYDPATSASFESPLAKLTEKTTREARDQVLDDWRRDLEHRRDVSRSQSTGLLRQQVLDFVNWLKAQGVI